MNNKNSYYIQVYTVFIVVFSSIHPSSSVAHGRYTRNIPNYELTIPHRVTPSGDFISFHIPEFYNHRNKRSLPKKLHYNVIFNGRNHHIELRPNENFLAPNMVQEWYDPAVPIPYRRIEKLPEGLCHYIGHIRGMRDYPVALSLCHGMAGYLTTDRGHYYIEPALDHQANEHGQLVHIVYKREVQASTPPHCGLKQPWTEAWTSKLREAAHKKRSGTQSLHRYLELLVVADKKFIDHHKNDNMENYILTIMNMVYSYYHDSSVGQQLDVSVVRIIYLEKPDAHLDLEISSNAENTLASFCEWAETVNPNDTGNPLHHDIAVLLTRYDLCSDNVTDCNLMGLAYLAAACDPKKACAINEDSGLALGITVTHEVGHVMGCGHDNGEDSPCQPQNSAGEYYVMSPFVNMQTTEWSSCSKQFITELFENQLGECLNDVPQESLYKENDMPPGSVYDADYQCNNEFPGSTHCVMEQSRVCEMLYCKLPGSDSCSSKGQPPADGTKCGQNMWCFNNKCVEIGQRPAAVDGGWCDWKPWTDCSRTCGGGISYSERECTNPVPSHRGKYCLGERKRVKLCNTVECPPGPTFRESQCSDYNSKPFKNKLHFWKPFTVEDNMCQLNCMNEERVWVTLAPRVKDGTSCKAGTKNKCIFGVCRKVGCDWVIDSTAVEDICGVCNGDGSSCNIIEKTYTDTGSGYQKIVTIPAGSRNIRVNEVAASENTIAVANGDGQTFYLNANYSEEINGDKDFGGVVGLYDHPSIDKETLFIYGPTKVPLILYAVFYNSKNPGIQYHYAEPNGQKGASESSSPNKKNFNWEFLEFSDCSARCGPGLKTSNPSCVEKAKGKVSDKFCAKIPKPEPKTVECNNRPCKTEWRAREWGPCSGCRSQSGTKTRIIDCVQETSEPGKDPMVIVDASLCSGPKPATTEVCCSNNPCCTTKRRTRRRKRRNDFEEKVANLWQQLDELRKRNKKYEDNAPTDNKNLIRKYKEMLKAREGGSWEDAANRFVSTYDHITEKTTTVADYIRHKKYYSIGKRSEVPCEPEKKKMVPGQMVNDKLPPEGNKLIEVPINEVHQDVHLSDAAFEAGGDQVADTLDFCNAKIYTGKQADAELTKIGKKNKT